MQNTALANARFATERNNLALAIAGLLPAAHNHADFFLAPDKRGQMQAACSLEPALSAGESFDAPRAYRLDDALQGLLAEVRVLECPARQPMGRVGDDDLVGARHPLNTCGEVRRFTHRELRYRGVTGTGLADDHRTGGNANAHLQRVRCLDFLDRLDNLQPGAYRPLGVILVCRRPAKIDHQPIAQILGDMARVAPDHHPASLLVGLHQAAQVLRIKPLRQRCRTDQIAKHDCDLATLGFAGLFDGDRCRRRRCRDPRCRAKAVTAYTRGFQDDSPGTDGKPHVLEIVFGQLWQGAEVNMLSLECVSKLTQRQPFQPLPDAHHDLPQTGIAESLYRAAPDCPTGRGSNQAMSRKGFSAEGRCYSALGFRRRYYVTGEAQQATAGGHHAAHRTVRRRGSTGQTTW